MGGWMDGWVDGWVGGWVDRETSGWVDELVAWDLAHSKHPIWKLIH
jgi:hypothetical protein